MYGVKQVYLGVDKVYSCPHMKNKYILSIVMKGFESSKEKYSINIVRSGKVYSMVQPSLETLSPTSLGLQFRHLLNSHQSKPRLRSPPDFH